MISAVNKLSDDITKVLLVSVGHAGRVMTADMPC